LKKIITGGRTTQKPEVGNIILENLKNKVKRQALGMYMQQDADLQRQHMISHHFTADLNGRKIQADMSAATIAVPGV